MEMLGGMKMGNYLTILLRNILLSFYPIER